MIEIKIDSSDIDRALHYFQNRVENLSPVMEAISGLLGDIIEENFETEGERLGGKWKPLKKKSLTRKKKKAEGISDQILQNEGGLITSFVPDFSDTEATISTDSPYSAIHNFGGRTGKNHGADMPQREFAALNEDDLNDIYELITDYFDNI